jgi:hypothetical protein
MSKLFKLKEWLTVLEAARHLSGVFEEEVTEADVLRLALDSRLRLSVYFVNHAKGRCGNVISWEETDWRLCPDSDDFPGGRLMKMGGKATTGECRPCPKKLETLYNELPVNERENYYPMMRSLDIDGERFLTLSDTVTTLSGVWDLPMIGAERWDVEHKYQNLTGGPEVTLSNLDGAFVQSHDGLVICQLQEDFDDNEFQSGSKAALEELKQRIAVEGIKRKQADALLKQHAENRKVFLEKRKGRSAKEKYYPAGGMPQDSVLVVRTEALREFEKAISNRAEPAVRDESLTAVIAALLAQWPNGKPPTGKDLEKAAQAIGLKISDDTIRKALKAARDLAPSLSA